MSTAFSTSSSSYLTAPGGCNLSLLINSVGNSFNSATEAALSDLTPSTTSSAAVAAITPWAHSVNFDPHGDDTLVVLHVQKTGGTEFLNHLVTAKKDGKYLCIFSEETRKMMETSQRLPKRIKRTKDRRDSKRNTILCPRDFQHPKGEQWLIAEKTMRWICGVHPSLTEYQNCLPSLHTPKFSMSRNLRYAIFLRHPVLRYISEYLHVQRNATWSTTHKCGGRRVSQDDMPPCYPGYYSKEPWTGVTLSKFVSCESNWANNRQTMMLADLESVHCFDRSALDKDERDRQLLESAKRNLENFLFFGLTEYMSESCQLLEAALDIKLTIKPTPRDLSDLHSSPIIYKLCNNQKLLEAILEANHLDIQLYRFAFELFSRRAKEVGITVDENSVMKQAQNLRADPDLLEKAFRKFHRLNYTIS